MGKSGLAYGQRKIDANGIIWTSLRSSKAVSIFHFPFSIFHFPFSICHLSFVICHLFNRMITEKNALIAGGVIASFAFGGACRRESEPREADDGRLTARPRTDVETSAKGESALGLGPTRDAILQLPARIAGGPLPLLVLFHGAGGSPEGVLGRLGSAPDEAGVAVLAPASRDFSWDGIRNSFGPDVTFVNRGLERVFDTVAVDPARIAVGGFSDGATYALSLGLINGDLFRRVVAFSPGFLIEGDTPRNAAVLYLAWGGRPDSSDRPLQPPDRFRTAEARLRRHVARVRRRARGTRRHRA